MGDDERGELTMPTFHYEFNVPAPASAVRAFHQDTRVLPRLSPPPIFVQLHAFEPLAEGSIAAFTMWFGPLPVRWQAVHRDVGEQGFRDEQVIGPLHSWRHHHRFLAAGPQQTRIVEEIDYEHKAGWRGWLTRLVFNRPGLVLLFTYRQLVTRLALQPDARPARRWAAAALGMLAALAAAAWLRARRRSA
jgi:ligand-binding SRPBCC domain-containing protein